LISVNARCGARAGKFVTEAASGGQEMDQASPRSPGSAIDGNLLLARALAPTLASAVDQIEERRELPAPVVSALIESGLFRLLQPRFFRRPARSEDCCRGHRGSRQARRQHRPVPLPGRCSMTAAYLPTGCSRLFSGMG
jgi:hypothetical protein